MTTCTTSRGSCGSNANNGYADQIVWYVDPVNGDDGNNGRTAKTAVKTLKEFCRRLRRDGFRYAEDFSTDGYIINLLSDVPPTDSMQLGGTIIAGDGGVVTQQEDTGTTLPLITIRGKVKAVADSTGTVQSFTAATATQAALLVRTSGTFAINTIARFVDATNTNLEGKRFYPATGGSATTKMNPRVGGATITAGDTFELVTLTKLGCQINWSGSGAQGVLVLVEDCWIPGDGENGTYDNGGAKAWQVAGCVLRFNHCLVNQIVTPNLGGRTKFGSGSKPSALVLPAPATEADIGFFTIERGATIAYSTTFVNVVLDVMTFAGQLQLGQCLLENAPMRGGGGSGEIEDWGGGAPSIMGDDTTCADWPLTIPANPFVDTGGTGDTGAALVLIRSMHASMGGGWRGGSAIGQYGLFISSAAVLELGPGDPGDLPTVSGGVSQILFDSNAVIARINPADGLPTAGSVINTFGAVVATYGAGGFGGSAMNLRNGTKIYSAPGAPTS